MLRPGGVVVLRSLFRERHDGIGLFRFFPEAARALHLERQSLYLRLHRIEEALGVSLEDEDVVLGLHLAVRARRFRRGMRG